MTYARYSKIDKGKKRVIYGFVGSVISITVIGLFFFLQADKVRTDSESNAVNIENREHNVVRASRDIHAGELADVAKFELVTVPNELIPDGSIKSMQELRNKRLKTQMEEKEFLMQGDLIESSEWYEDGDRLIEHIFQDGAIPTTVEIGSIVDIILFKPNGEDCVVVSKTAVIGKNDKILSFYLNKIEQENIKEANIEGMLFLVQYLDKSQSASEANYQPLYK